MDQITNYPHGHNMKLENNNAGTKNTGTVTGARITDGPVKRYTATEAKTRKRRRREGEREGERGRGAEHAIW